MSNHKDWKVLEQIVEDPASELILHFKLMPDGEPRLVITGPNLPFGNREIIFDNKGVAAGSGTYTGPCLKEEPYVQLWNAGNEEPDYTPPDTGEFPGINIENQD